jgi:molybdenum cofactor cytidylyltransferase
VIAGVILAGGASRRMGRPKALLDYRGETFAGRLIRVLSGACDPVIVALGHQEAVIRPHLNGAHFNDAARFVVNPDPERGQLSSLQVALDAVPSEAEGFLFIPVDCPALEPGTLSRVVEAFRGRDASTLFVIPSYRGRHGHPVCAARELLPEFLALSPTGQAREVVHRHIAHTQYIDVDDAGILVDIDDAEAYRRLAGANPLEGNPSEVNPPDVVPRT